MDYTAFKIAYVVANLKRVGPTNQTLNIIRYSGAISNCVVITLFDEPADTLIQQYIDNGIHIECLHLTHNSMLTKGVNNLYTSLCRNHVQLVHSYGTFADILSTHACKRANINHMITLKNFPMEDMPTRMNPAIGTIGARVVLHYLKRCKHVVCCSKSIEKKMQDTYHWNNLSSIQNGVDYNKFTPSNRQQMRQKMQIPEDRMIVISTGSIIPRKRISETADAFLNAQLGEKAELWFLGSGPLLASLKVKYEPYKSIKFMGNRSNISDYLSCADLFVSSSESEGMPNAVLEALACGLPVYLSDIPQHLEILEAIPGCGKSYELGNPKQLSELLMLLSLNDIAKMKANTTQLQSSDLTMERMGLKYADFYRAISSETYFS